MSPTSSRRFERDFPTREHKHGSMAIERARQHLRPLDAGVDPIVLDPTVPPTLLQRDDEAIE